MEEEGKRQQRKGQSGGGGEERECPETKQARTNGEEDEKAKKKIDKRA